MKGKQLSFLVDFLHYLMRAATYMLILYNSIQQIFFEHLLSACYVQTVDKQTKESCPWRVHLLEVWINPLRKMLNYSPFSIFFHIYQKQTLVQTFKLMVEH